MPTSQVDICNVAILDVGGTVINAISDNSVPAKLCDQYWDVIVREVLSEHKWNFAKKWVALAIDSGYDMLDETYTYAYELPSDYVRMSMMENIKSTYTIRGTNLLTGVEDAKIEYIRLVEDVNEFTPGFVMALVSRLRASLAIPLARKSSKAIDWMGQYMNVDLPAAKMKDAQDINPNTHTTVSNLHTDDNDTWLGDR